MVFFYIKNNGQNILELRKKERKRKKESKEVLKYKFKLYRNERPLFRHSYMPNISKHAVL